eukprot:snap_masked-scaffold_77-processed-gene-0.19-mRNA-1 protein AED:1.00 eAED:1.00 QI:0/0/0/0/1/1/2/0/156
MNNDVLKQIGIATISKLNNCVFLNTICTTLLGTNGEADSNPLLPAQTIAQDTDEGYKKENQAQHLKEEHDLPDIPYPYEFTSHEDHELLNNLKNIEIGANSNNPIIEDFERIKEIQGEEFLKHKGLAHQMHLAELMQFSKIVLNYGNCFGDSASPM